MTLHNNIRFLARTLTVTLLASLISPGNASSQTPTALYNPTVRKAGLGEESAPRENKDAAGESWTIKYADPAQGASSADLISRALQSNTELAAIRLDLERARARLRRTPGGRDRILRENTTRARTAY